VKTEVVKARKRARQRPFRELREKKKVDKPRGLGAQKFRPWFGGFEQEAIYFVGNRKRALARETTGKGFLLPVSKQSGRKGTEEIRIGCPKKN